MRRILVSPYEIHYLRFLMEAYEGLAVVSTLDPLLGLVLLQVAPGCEEDVERILQGEREELGWRPVSDCAGEARDGGVLSDSDGSRGRG